MAIKITLKNSVVQDSVPTTSHLAAVGELALNANINSLGIYMRASDNSIVKMAGPGSVTTPAASTTVAGIAELATSAETTTGTDTARVTTPAGVKAVTDAERTTSNNTYLALAGGTLTGVLAATAGSNSAASIHFGDTDSGIFGGTNTVSLTAGGTTRLTADTGVSVTGALAVTGTITSTDDLTIPDKIIHSGDIDTAIRFPEADTVSVETGGSERARVDSSGRLLVGLTSARTLNSGYTPPLQVEGNTATTSSISAINNINQTGGPSVWLGKSRGAALGGVTTVQSGDELGSIFFNGADGTDIQSIGASIVAKSNGTVAGNRMPGELLFATTADSAGSVAPTTRLTITSAGVVNVPDNGQFTVGASSDLSIYHNGSHNFIESTNGNTYLWGGGAQLRAVIDAQVELYYDNSLKFDTQSDGAKFYGDLYSNDANKIKLGNSQDLQLWHDGSNSYITNSGSGNLYIDGDTDDLVLQAGDDVRIQTQGNENAINCVGNGAVELYYDDSKKFETTSGGVKISGTNLNMDSTYIDFSGDVSTPTTAAAIYRPADNTLAFSTANTERLKIESGGNIRVIGTLRVDDGSTSTNRFAIGTGGDLLIYHKNDGTEEDSYIDNYTGDLYIRGGPNIRLTDRSNNKMILCQDGGQTQLYCDGSQKLNTKSDGIEVTGTVQADQFALLDGEKATYGDSNELQIYHSSDHNYIHSDVGDLNICVDTGAKVVVQSGTSGNHLAEFNFEGSVELFHNAQRVFETQTGGIRVQGPQDGACELLLYADEGDQAADMWRIRSEATASEWNLQNYKDGAWENSIKAYGASGTKIYYDNTWRFETLSTGIVVNGTIRNQGTYDQTTVNAANMYVHSSPYDFYRSTSSIKYKDNVTTLTDAEADTILNCRPVTYTSKCSVDNSDDIHYGLIAEEVKDVDPRLVVFEGSEPEGVKYDRFVPHLINLVKRLTDKVKTLETKVAALEGA